MWCDYQLLKRVTKAKCAHVDCCVANDFLKVIKRSASQYRLRCSRIKMITTALYTTQYPAVQTCYWCRLENSIDHKWLCHVRNYSKILHYNSFSNCLYYYVLGHFQTLYCQKRRWFNTYRFTHLVFCQFIDNWKK